MRVRLPSLIASLLLLLATGAPALGAPGEIAVAPFAVDRDGDGTLRPIADACLERLVGGLTAKGIAVERRPKLSEKDLRAARPARWAVLGRLTREAGQIRAELRLLEVESGDELRSYFSADKDPAAVARLGEAAAARIASVIREQKGAGRGQ